MLADYQGWNGITISGVQAVDARLAGSEAQWWRAVAQLEAWGVITHVRTYKPGHGDRTVGICRNWYGPGPKLAAMRAVYFEEIEKNDETPTLDAWDEAVESKRKSDAGARRRRRRERAGVHVSAAWASTWPELPAWHVALVGAMQEEAEGVRAVDCFELGHLGVELPPTVDAEQEAALSAALAAEGFAPASDPPPARGDDEPCAGVDGTAAQDGGSPIVKALSSCERSTEGSEFKLGSTPAGAAVPSSPAQGSSSPRAGGGSEVGAKVAKAPPCCPADAGGRTRADGDGPPCDRTAPRPAGGPKSEFDAFVGKVEEHGRRMQALVDERKSETWLPGMFAATAEIAQRLAGERCQLCGSQSLAPAGGGLVRCQDCSALLCPD